ncbi:MAG: TIGR04282 family arsenosugar biosynthesis glycosyltransferase [Microcoleaceae cyanobacterium MO_207.B10]|nr:TIGR04282 family arsenosugar biosynthesis glycosyltransferase [Microcoleaceae cyanobacterium MO_207.B10]
MNHQHLIIFTRYPEPGKTKTRLIPALGKEGAANLQRQMTEQTVAKVKQLQDEISLSFEIRFVGGDIQLIKNWLGSDLKYQEQGEGDLGDRLIRAFQAAFKKSNKYVVIIGIDCPKLSSNIISEAFEKLTKNDLVIGPATDGGYYLIGLSKFIPELFKEINWGSSQVLEKTVKLAELLGLVFAYLPPLSDIDRPEDLNSLDETL